MGTVRVMRVMRAVSALGGFLLLAGVQFEAGQARAPAEGPRSGAQDLPTFKVAINYVELDVTVTDADGNPVDDLARGDFHVIEDGTPQAVTVFSHVRIPIERPRPEPLWRAPTVAPDVYTNRRESDGRLIALLLDDLHTDFGHTTRVREAATSFVERYLGPDDLAAVVHTSGVRGTGQEFTGSRPLLRRAIEQFAGRRLTVGTDAERLQEARTLLAAVRKVAEYLEGIRSRRKAVVLFSEGVEFDLGEPVASRTASDLVEAMRTTIGAAARANVALYAVDPAGLAVFDTSIGDLPVRPAFGPPTPETPAGPAPGTPVDLFAHGRKRQASLKVLAEQTGGIAVINRNDYGDGFERIIRDNSSYYLLGYHSQNTRREGRFRQVTVTVSRPGLHVRTRTGYVVPRERPVPAHTAPRQAASPELREALNNPIPAVGVAMTVSAIPFRGSSRHASVLLVYEVAGSTFGFADGDGAPSTHLEVVALPFDAGGRPRPGTRDAVTIRPKPHIRDAVVTRGVRLLRRLDLPAGRYHVRLGIRESASGARGTVGLDLDVPDFRKGPLAMSGLLVIADSGQGIPTLQEDERLADFLPGAPTLTREFSSGDEIALFAEIYGAPGIAEPVEITTSLSTIYGQTVGEQRDLRSGDEFRRNDGRYRYLQSISLGVPPGRYLVRVQARMGSNGPAVRRELEITVR